MGNVMAAKLSAGDYAPVSTGEASWLNATCWERANLVREGYLKSDSPRGVWELSDEGKGLSEMLG